jgi:benzylsuccinate CoA-transferase BbsF subunit
VTQKPLEGVRVADFTWVGAGPFLTKPLADHGAEVIKIESRTRIDSIRSMRPFRDGIPGVNRSGYFANRNSSKRSICLDLKQPAGRGVALQLMVASDVVTNNFTPGTMDKLGIGYEAVRAVRPDIIYLEMPMQGNTGPHMNHRGYGLTISALGGLLGLSGWADRPPLGTGTNYPDHVPNPLHSAVAVLAALRHRRRTGEGAYIEVAQIESTVNLIGGALIAEQLHAGSVGRRGNLDDRAAPHGVYPCRGEDRWCAIAVLTDEQWRRATEVLGRPDLSVGKYATIAGRRGDVVRLDEEMSNATSARDADELADALAAAGVAAAPVNDAADLVERDPQLRARGHWVTLDHPEMGPSLYDAPPYRLSRTPGRLRSAAPLLGADTRDVCVDLLGMSPERYADLEREGAVG